VQVPATIVVKSAAAGTGIDLDVALIDASGNALVPDWSAVKSS
jgi:hypothetical protein